jgi:hypothetical protein
MAGRIFRSSSWTIVRPSLNILHHCLRFLHSLHLGRKPPRIIHDVFPHQSCFLAWRMQTTARIAQLAVLSIAGHIITHSVETRTNTMWWFTREWVMWRYLPCASSPPLLNDWNKRKLLSEQPSYVWVWNAYSENNTNRSRNIYKLRSSSAIYT